MSTGFNWRGLELVHTSNNWVASYYMLSIVGYRNLKRSSQASQEACSLEEKQQDRADVWKVKWDFQMKGLYLHKSHTVPYYRSLPLKKIPAAGVLPMWCFRFSFPSSLIRLLCLSKAHTIHIISIQIQNLFDYCSECNVIQGFFFSERAPIWHAFLILCAICKCHHCSC